MSMQTVDAAPARRRPARLWNITRRGPGAPGDLVTKGSQRLLRRRSLFSAAFVCALIGVLSPISVLAQSALQAGQSAVVANTEGRGLRLRGGPAMTYRVVSTVPEGTSVQIIAGPVSDGGDDWYQVSAGGTTGWGVGQYLSSGPVMRAMSVNENGMRVFLAKTTAYSDGIGGISMGARTSSGTNTRWG